jgi:hypothetical protein
VRAEHMYGRLRGFLKKPGRGIDLGKAVVADSGSAQS